MDYTEIAHLAVKAAMDAGADEAEAYLTVEDYLSLTARMKEIEKVERAGVTGLGLKVFKDRRKAYVTGTGLTARDLKVMARRALDYAAETCEEESNRLCEEAVGTSELTVFDTDLARQDLQTKIDLLLRLEGAAYDRDPRVKNTEEADYWDGTFEKIHVNSRGLVSREKKTHCGLSLSVLAMDGDERQVGAQYQAVRYFSKISPEEVGEEAARHALRKLGARPVKSQKAPVVFDNRIGLRFLGYLIAAVNGERVALNETFLAGKVGESIAPAHVSIVDECDREGGYANSIVDGEGIRTENKNIVSDGVLTTYLHNLHSALKLGALPTGNVQRGSYEREGALGAHNLYLAPGKSSREEILGSVKSGLLVTNLMGMGLNIASGHYSIGASGLWIENGQITHPVERVTIASTVQAMLMGIEEVADDLRFWAGSGSPTFKISEMTISGE